VPWKGEEEVKEEGEAKKGEGSAGGGG